MTVKPGITLSVVSHGQRALLQPLLDDLAHLRPDSLRRLVVTLNLDEPAPRLDPIPGCETRILCNARPLGFGANHNQAFRQCETEWFAILNPDLRLPEDPFAPLLAAAREDTALLVPIVLDRGRTQADARRRLLTPLQLVQRILGRRVPAAPSEVDWFAGMFLLIRSAAFSGVQGFDPRYYMYCEDADLALRLQLAGWRLQAVDDVAVLHAAQRASHRSAQYLRWHVASLVKHWASTAYWRYLSRRRALRDGTQHDREK